MTNLMEMTLSENPIFNFCKSGFSYRLNRDFTVQKPWQIQAKNLAESEIIFKGRKRIKEGI